MSKTAVSTDSATDSSSALAAGRPVENLEARRLFASSLAYGINANAISSSTYPEIVSMMRDTGTKTARLWMSINGWGHNETGIFKYIRRFANEGFDIMVTAVPKQGGSYETVKDYFNWASDKLGSSVDRWQIGNELDFDYGTSANGLGRYVDTVLAPAAAGLHANGEKVVSGAVSWNPEHIKTLVEQGMLNHVDFVGYHPYRNSVADLQKCVAQVKDYANGKPLIASEWNVRSHEGNKGEWNDAIKEYWPTIRDNFYAAYYFAAVKVGTRAGPAGVITNGGSPNGEFYSTYKGLKNNFSSGGAVAPTRPAPAPAPTPEPTPNVPAPVTNGNQPSATGKPSVGGFRIFDAVTGQVIKGYENVTTGQTIKLSSLANRKIQIRALTTSNTQSVKFTFSGRATRTENTAPYTVFGDSRNRETPWYATAGRFTLGATAYSADYAKGAAGAKLSLILNFV
ncbi:MAG TPA: hypothetical protein VF595_02835 [Tepidisphaeraceae bacterium]